MKILILILLSMDIYAQKAHFRRLRPITDTVKIKASAPQKGVSNYLKAVLRSNKLLKNLLSKNVEPDRIVIWEDKKKTLTGSVLRGVLLNSISSTNLDSPVLIKSLDNPFLGAKFSCHAVTKFKRVKTICDRMIFNNHQYEVSVEILNIDGTAGLLGSYDDGKADLIVGAIATQMASAVISSAMDISETNYTKYPKSNLKNHLISGAVSSGQKASEIMLEDAKTKEPIVSVNSGKQVLIYFKESFYEH